MNAYDEIYQQYAREVYLYLLKLSGNPALAEDLMQNTFLKAVEKQDTFQGKSKISTWLCAIAKNEYLNEWKRKENQNLPLDVAKEYIGQSFENKMVDKEFSKKIHKILHGMKEPYKEVFTLRVFGELSFREIGELFDRTDLWARVTYRRAKEKIVGEMKEER